MVLTPWKASGPNFVNTTLTIGRHDRRHFSPIIYSTSTIENFVEVEPPTFRSTVKSTIGV